MFRSLFRKNRETSKQRSTRTASRWTRPALSVEHLEDRLVMDCGGIASLPGQVADFLNDVNPAFQNAISASKATLPIINKSLDQLTGIAGTITDIQQALNSGLGQFTDGAIETQLEQFVDQALDSVGLKLAPTEVHLEDANIPNDDVIKVDVHLGKILFQTNNADFGIGLPSIPFIAAQANAEVHAQVDFKLDLEFGIHKNCDFFINPGPLGLHAEAGLNSGSLHGELGFLQFDAKTSAGKQNGFHGDFTFDLAVDPQDNTKLAVTPTLSGGADINLDVSAGITGQALSAPGISSNFMLHWGFNSSQFSKPDSTFGGGGDFQVAFNNVQVNLGSYLTKQLRPVVEKIQQFTEPYKDFFKLLGDPIPVVSDLAKVIGDQDGVSILDLAGVAADSGKISPEYSALIKIAKIVIQVTNVIDAIELQKGAALQNAWIPIGSFDLVGNQAQGNGKDLREVTPAIDAGFGKLDLKNPNWSDLAKLAENIDLSQIKTALHDNLGDLGDQLGEALENLKQATQGNPNNHASINLSFPIIDHPAKAILGLLVGQDSDLVSFTADAKLDTTSTITAYALQVA